MYTTALVLITVCSATLGTIAWVSLRRFRKATKKHTEETAKKEQELKQRVLELQIARLLGERIGYTLDIRQILEVISDSRVKFVFFL